MSPYSNFYRDKHVLITGGLGFVGSNLAHRLVELGAKVLLVDSMIPEYGGNVFNISDIRDRVTVNFADIRDWNGMTYLVQGQDVIFNLAGQVSHIDSMHDPFTDMEINCRSQLGLLEACRKVNARVKVVYASTRQIYGKPNSLPVTEQHVKRPTDVNGINKMAGEWYHIVYNNVYGIPACALRMTNTYGPRQLMKHNRQGFLAWFIRRAIAGEEIQLFGDGSQLRDVTYVDDVVEAFLLVAATDETNGRVFNLGGCKPVSLKEIVTTLLEITGTGNYRIVPFPPDHKVIDIGDYYADYSKIRRFVGWQPAIGLAEGLAKTVDYYRRHRAHYW